MFPINKEFALDLLHPIGSLISHNNPHTNPVSSAELLVVPLCYLATVISFGTLSAGFKLGSPSVGVVREVCTAIWTTFKGDYVGFPIIGKWSYR